MRRKTLRRHAGGGRARRVGKPLYSSINGTWFRNAYTYTAASGAAVITSPAPGTTLGGFSATFNWSTTAGATAYWLDVGTAPAQGNIFGGNVGTATSHLVTGLRLNGSTVYVTLYSVIGGAWQGNAYTYTAATGQDPKAAMLTPAPGSTLSGGSATFNWGTGTGVSAYWLDGGTSPGVGNLFGGNVGTVTSKLVSGIPTNGSTIYVNLYSNIGGDVVPEFVYLRRGAVTGAAVRTSGQAKRTG